MSTRWVLSAFATAERSVLATSRAPRLGVYSRRLSALSTGLPRIRSTTSRAFCAVIRMNRLCARASITRPPAPCGARPPPLPLPPLQDPAVRALVVACLVALGRLAPRRLGVIALGASLAPAVWMVDRVHGDPAHARPPPEPAHPAGLPERDVLVLEVADLPDRRPAGESHAPELPRGELEQRVVAFLCHELDAGPGAAPELSPAPLAELHVVHRRAERDVRQRQAVSRLDVRLRAGLDLVADAEPDRRQDVALLPVRVVEERDPGRAVRIVLDGRHPGRHALLLALEVHEPVEALVPPAPVPDGHPAEVVPAARLAQRRGERGLRRLLGDLVRQRALLGDHRTLHDLGGVHDAVASGAASRLTTCSSAGRVKTISAWPRTS